MSVYEITGSSAWPFFYFRWDDKERGCNEQACQEKGGKGNNVDGGDTIQTSRVLQFLDIANCLAI